MILQRSVGMRLRSFGLCIFLVLPFCFLEASAQRTPDFDFKPPIAQPAYPSTKGPVVLMDEAHANTQKVIGPYLSFANLLFRDGYNIKSLTTKFTRESLGAARILVIANATAQRVQAGFAPPSNSAFTDDEIIAVRDWVRQGGSLLLIVDHMPAPAANQKLAGIFGIEFHNGYAIEAGEESQEMNFKLSDGGLRDHPILRGRNVEEVVTSVTTFTGSAFRLVAPGDPLLVLGKSVESFAPAVEGAFLPNTPRTPVGGWLQGATLRYGKGRIAVFGEANMFSAEISGLGKKPMGMNQPGASRNPQFLLNVIHWLSGLLGN
jgi:hypothetical protein